ncbi:hypothetical protein LY632_09030 [Erythrobacter sp. SDW2]|uniref:hypothetical protein n=1 Tax=Erythrobacter sp. SDW2 TaxID=2907154 RepID=UPI001F358E2F|nr:hypothetical protein [Erythrobacter sp. SDW2]UIP05850.1 hypothetical protein LY632_09030 [Erythrobacter sp. SDW2]
MSNLERQLREDRVLRNAAHALFKADIERVKTDLEEKTVGKRALDRARDGAAELLDNAQAKVGDNIGIVALLFGAIALWFARNPIMAMFTGEAGEEDDTPQPPMGDDT